MTEIVEYCLVVMVSALFVAGSAATYGAFQSFESSLQFKASSAAVESLALQAVSNGSSRAELDLPSSGIMCSGGSLQFTAGARSSSEPIGLSCDFAVRVPPGPHVLSFGANRSTLIISVE